MTEGMIHKWIMSKKGKEKHRKEKVQVFKTFLDLC